MNDTIANERPYLPQLTQQMDAAVYRLFDLFDELKLDCEVIEHPAVFTVEEAERLVPAMNGIETKNMFVRDAKGQRHFLIVMRHDRRLDLTALAACLGTSKLSMGSADRLGRHLGVVSGAVSVFAVINDHAAAVELIVDEEVWQAQRVLAHPLCNTATVSIAHDSLKEFLEHAGHLPVVMRVP